MIFYLKNIFGLLTLVLWLQFTWLNSHANDGREALDLHCERCNVVFLNLDFLRADYVGLLNGTNFTPNIDRFFENSIIFENVSSPAGSSYRGNLSVLTATEPHIYDVDVESFHLMKNTKTLGPWERVFTANTTIAQVLSNIGYRTVNLNKGRRSGRGTFLDRGFDHYKQFRLWLVIEDLLPSLERNLRSTAQPFFLLFHAVPTRLHRAFYPINRQRVIDEDIIYKEYPVDNVPYGYKVLRNRTPSLSRQRAAEHTIYAQQLVYADEQIANIFPLLSDIAKNTIIVLYSNHGTQLGDKGIFASNGVSYQSCIHVPLIIKHPSVNKQVRIKTSISLIDFVPTVYEFLGMTKPKEAAGVSLVSLIKHGDYSREYLVGKNDLDEYIRLKNWKLIIRTERDRELYDLENDPLQRVDLFDLQRERARHMEYIVNFGSDNRMPIIDNNWKLVVHDKKQYELYDLGSDPGETNNLAMDKPLLRDFLKAKLKEFKDRARANILKLAAG